MRTLVLIALALWGCEKKSGWSPTVADTDESDSPADDSATSDPDDTGQHRPDDTAIPEDTAAPPPPDPCDSWDPSDGRPEGAVDCRMGICAVQAGLFYMGSVDGHADECPVRHVDVDAFRIDESEVTWGEYENCVEAGACTAPPTYCRERGEALSEGALNNLPVFCVKWSQANDYCAHEGGRLPTEAEWEKAARGTRGSEWPWGDAVPSCDFANFRFVSWYCMPGVIAVGSYENQSPFGPVDMIGNAWEWVADFYDAEWYRESGTDNPVGPTEGCRPSVGTDPETCVDRVMRGGAYNVTEFQTRSAARTAAHPNRVDDNIGFRCAYEAE